MFTTGSKLLFGASGASLVGTLLYGILVGGIMGTVGLVSLTTGLIFIAGITRLFAMRTLRQTMSHSSLGRLPQHLARRHRSGRSLLQLVAL